MNSKDELIIEIFNNMNFEDNLVPENNYGDGSLIVNKLGPVDEILKNDRKPKSFVSAVSSAREAFLQWKKFSALDRADSLHVVWKALIDKLDKVPGLNFPILVDYFDLYADMAAQVKNSSEPVGVVLVVLPPNPCFFILGATVPAALAAGCCVIIHSEQAAVPLFLEDIIINTGLPDGIFSVVTEPLVNHNSLFEKIQQTIYCGPFSAAQEFYFEKKFESFKFFSPNNTAAFVLESSDLSAAVAEIFHKTWEHPSFWAVSTVVVQESIVQKFLDALKFQMDHFLSTKNQLKFKNGETLEKINNIILDAVRAGAEVLKASCNEREWGPTALVNYQNQKEEMQILKILVSRTSKEGVKLLNNCVCALGTSIWTEFSAQALEIASQLKSPNVWINCHGVVDANVPISLSGLSGNLVLGGRRGILEYLSPGVERCLKSNPENGKVSAKSAVLQTLLSAQKALDSWHLIRNKRKHFKTLADSFGKTKEFSEHAQTVNCLACFANRPNVSEKNSTEEFFIVYEEVPVGVLCLYVSNEMNARMLIFLIAAPIALGNAVILVMNEENSFVTYLVNFFNKIFPKNLLTVIYGKDGGLFLASDPAIQALWIYNENVLAIQDLRKESSKNLKPLWIIPKNISLHEELIAMRCVTHKAIWLPKVEKFP